MALTQKEKIQEAIDELNWDSDNINDIMEGFFNSPSDVIDLDKCTDSHLNALFDLLECEQE